VTGADPGLMEPLILSWNMRNLGPGPADADRPRFRIEGSLQGQYPLDGWRPYPIEVTARPLKSGIAGRGFSAFGIAPGSAPWEPGRAVRLPLYRNCELPGADQLGTLFLHWPEIFLTDDMPCLAVAAKATGRYCEDREAQSVTVLLAWSDGAARLVNLDWAEGPLEDCVTPEWCVQRGELTNLGAALGELLEVHRRVAWELPRFFLYAIPSCLGSGLGGTRTRPSYTPWTAEWAYQDYPAMSRGLSLLVSRIRQAFVMERGD